MLSGRRPNPSKQDERGSQRTDASKMNAAHLPCAIGDLTIPMSIACDTNIHRKQREREPHTKGAAPLVSEYRGSHLDNTSNAHTDISSNASSDADVTMDSELPPSGSIPVSTFFGQILSSQSAFEYFMNSVS